MKAYWYDNLPGDQREDHNSGRAVDPAYLNKLGVLHYNLSTVDEVNALAEKRSYKNRDEIIVSPTTLPNYEEKVKGFFHEHLHEDEEIRWIREGGGFFDFRSRDDEWVRIALEKDDLLIMPSGIFHRFTTDTNNYVKAMRLFKEEPKWTPLNRDATVEQNPYRQEYLKSVEA